MCIHGPGCLILYLGSLIRKLKKQLPSVLSIMSLILQLRAKSSSVHWISSSTLNHWERAHYCSLTQCIAESNVALPPIRIQNKGAAGVK